MDKHGVDALIASTPENVVYASGYWARNRLNYLTQNYVVLPRDPGHRPCLILPTSKLSAAAQIPLLLEEIESYGVFHTTERQEGAELDGPSRRLARLRQRLGRAGGGPSGQTA